MQLARRPGSQRLFGLIAVATGLLTFAFAGAGAATKARVDQAAVVVGLSAVWARSILKRWNAEGPDGLADRRAGTNGGRGKLTTDQQIDLWAALQQPPPDGGIWTGPKVAGYARDRWGVSVGKPTGWRWLRGLGFSAEVHSKAEIDTQDHFAEVMPEDLIKFGLIPEFIGRLPVVASVTNLDKDSLVQILSKPKNAMVKQYTRLFEMDGVELEFTDEALESIADQAIHRGTGARGLRAIMEEVLLPVMYDIPSRDDVAKVVVTQETVEDNVLPTIVPRKPSRTERRDTSA